MEGLIKAKLPENALHKLLQKLQESGSPSSVEYDISINNSPVLNDLSNINLLPNDKLQINLKSDKTLIKSNFKQNKAFLEGKYEIIR